MVKCIAMKAFLVMASSSLLVTQANATSDMNTAYEFSSKLEEYARNVMGAGAMQAHLDDTNFEDSLVDGSTLVSLISTSLSQKFNSRFDAVRNLRNDVERNWADYNSQNVFEECCSVTPPEFDYSFKTETDRNTLCVFGQGIKKNPKKFPQGSLLETMKRNIQTNPAIKWQYLGTEEGVIANYPAFHLCSPQYDPRFRPWYAETTAPAPKDIVIIIDTSGSMTATHGGRSLMSIAIEAGQTVIDTLGPNDRVNVVAFSSQANTPPGTSTTSDCFSSDLAVATPQNKGYLKEFIGFLNAEGETQYGLALNAAFDLFDKASQNGSLNMRGNSGDTDKAILFLTDGEPDDRPEDILHILRERNAAHNNSVVIMPFALGSGGESAVSSILQDMGHQIQYDPSFGEIRRSDAVWVEDANNLRSEMASYYNFFVRTGGSNDVTVTVPYFDAFGLGLVTSACLPVFHLSEHKGVVCVDIAISDLLSDVTYFKPGPLSYAFLIDGVGRLLMHPYLPEPLQLEDDPIFLTMPVLEVQSQAEEVFRSMIRSESGNASFSSRRITSRGNSVIEGIDDSLVPSHYFWNPIQHTRLSVCVVIGDSDKQASINWAGGFPAKFVYHRLDLVDNGVYTCSHAGREAAKDISAVKFAPETFRDPYLYVTTEEMKNNIDQYSSYFEGQTSQNPGFKEGTRDDVLATAIFDEIAHARNSSAYDSALWTYVGLEGGVFRVFPGIQLHKMYDHTKRPWYLRALALKTLTVSMPYEDAFGAGKVITLSKVLYEGKPDGSHTVNDKVIGVTSVDFAANFFYVQLLKTFTECEYSNPGCFVVDSSGFLVMHTDWYVQGADPQENEHIIKREPQIAQELLNRNIMTRSSCASFVTHKNQHFFRLHTSQMVLLSHGKMFPVVGTNVFVIVLTNNPPDSDGTCYCGDFTSGLPDCTRPAGWKCECPCELRTTYYQYCTNTYQLTADTPPACFPPSPADIAPETEDDSGASNLLPCYKFSCDAQNKLDCLAVHGCEWTGSSCVHTRVTDKTRNNRLKIGLGVGIPLGVIVLALWTFFLYRWLPSKSSNGPKNTGSSPQVYANAALDTSTTNRTSLPPFNPNHPDILKS